MISQNRPKWTETKSYETKDFHGCVEFVSCWPSTAEDGAQSKIYFVFPVRLHWREPIFLFVSGDQLETVFRLWMVTCSLLSELGPHLMQTHTGPLCAAVSVSSYVHRCCCFSLVSSIPSGFYNLFCHRIPRALGGSWVGVGWRQDWGKGGGIRWSHSHLELNVPRSLTVHCLAMSLCFCSICCSDDVWARQWSMSISECH